MLKVYYWEKKSQALILAWRILAETDHYVWFEQYGATEPFCIRKQDIITIKTV